MTLRALTLALAVSAGAALLAPGTAEARHRHDRYCGHGYYGRSPRYSQSYRYDYGRHHRSYPRSYRYGGYGYYPRGYYYDRYYAPPPGAYFHYHGRRRCSRVHVGLFFGW